MGNRGNCTMMVRELRNVMLCTLVGAMALTIPEAFSQHASAMIVSSPTMFAGEPIPVAHTADGRDESPALNWKNAPAGTNEFAVIRLSIFR